ncbi:MAG: hypothetical protein AAGF92_17230 [Myxococcota bacterium]
MERLAMICVVLAATTACDKSGRDAATAHQDPGVCMTAEARSVTTQPDFEAGYQYCAKGNRAIGRPATLECLEKKTGLTTECASCYSWYKACVLQSCFKSCHTPRPEPYCRLCARTSCRGMFYRCAGTQDAFPASESGS